MMTSCQLEALDVPAGGSRNSIDDSFACAETNDQACSCRLMKAAINAHR